MFINTLEILCNNHYSICKNLNSLNPFGDSLKKVCTRRLKVPSKFEKTHHWLEFVRNLIPRGQWSNSEYVNELPHNTQNTIEVDTIIRHSLVVL